MAPRYRGNRCTLHTLHTRGVMGAGGVMKGFSYTAGRQHRPEDELGRPTLRAGLWRYRQADLHLEAVKTSYGFPPPTVCAVTPYRDGRFRGNTSHDLGEVRVWFNQVPPWLSQPVGAKRQGAAIHEAWGPDPAPAVNAGHAVLCGHAGGSSCLEPWRMGRNITHVPGDLEAGHAPADTRVCRSCAMAHNAADSERESA